MRDKEEIESRRIMPFFSNKNLQQLRRQIAYWEEQRANLMRDAQEKPADDNERLLGILNALSVLNEHADRVTQELEDRGWTEWDELSLEPPPMDPSWIWNDSTNMDASWFTNRLDVDKLRADPEDASGYESLLDAYQDGDELWEFRNPASGWYIDCVCQGTALVRYGKIIKKEIYLTS